MNSSSSLSLPSTLFTPPPSVPPCFVSLPDWLSPCRIFPNSSLAFRLYQRLDVTNFRHSLYLITPWETTFGSVEEVPNYNVQMSAWWLLLIFIELLLLQLTGHSDRFALNDSITSICAGMLSQCFKFGGRAIAIFGYVWIWDNCRVVELPWQWPGTWALYASFRCLCCFIQVRPFFHWFSLRDHTHGVPMPECPPIVYSPPLAVWLKAYVLVHFLLLLAVFLHFEYDRLELGWPDFLLKLAFFVFTMQSFGAIFDLRPWVGYLEIFRCIGVIAYYAGRMVLERAGFRRLNHLFVVSFFALSALLWMGVLARRGWHKWQEARRRVRAVVMDEDKEKKSNNNVNERAMGEEEMAKGMYVGGGTMEWNNNGRRMDNKATIPTVDGQLQQQQGKNYY